MPVNWKELLTLVGPTLASGADPAFMRGFERARALKQQEREQQQQADQAKQAQGAQFKLELLNDLMQIDDPVVFQQMKDAAAEAGETVYGMPREAWAYVAFPESKTQAKQIAELDQLLESLEGRGYDLDELATSGSAVQLSDGRSVPVSSAIELTRRAPMSAEGQRVPRPKKAPPVTAGTETERAATLLGKIRAAEAAGDTQAAAAFRAEYDDLQTARGDMRAPVDPEMVDMNKTLKRLAIDAAQNRNQGGLPPGTEFSMSERLAAAWRTASGSAHEMNRQLTLMETGLKRFREGDKIGGAQAVLVTFQKILDPTSVVRESEYARSASGLSLMDAFQGYVERLREGGPGVPDPELAGMVQTAREFLRNMQSFSQGQRKRIEAQAKKYQLDPATIFDDVLLDEPPPADPAASAIEKLRQR